MRHLKLPLLFLTLLLLVIASSFLSVHPKLVKYTISGTIEVMGGSAESAMILFLEADEKFSPETIKHGHRAYTEKDGSFKTDFGAIANTDIQLFVIKSGFYPIRHVVETARRPGEEKQPIAQPILVAGQLDEPVHYIAPTDQPSVAVHFFRDPCAQTLAVQLEQEAIHYLEKVHRIGPNNCRQPRLQQAVLASITTIQGINLPPSYFDAAATVRATVPVSSVPLTEVRERH